MQSKKPTSQHIKYNLTQIVKMLNIVKSTGLGIVYTH